MLFSALTALLLYHQLPPYMQDESQAGVVDLVTHGALKTTWWVGCALLLSSCARMFLTFERKPREGRLLQDLVVALIYLTAALCIVAYVFRLPVATVVATSGVFAIVLGLALQSTLNDVFSGIALNLGRPLTVGDWIVLDDGIQGKVIETNWRSTQLLSGTNDLIVVPNSVLAKSRITNLSGPDSSHGASIKVRLVPTKPLKVILETLDRALLSSNSALKSPPPSVSVLSLDKDVIEIELSYRISELSRAVRARNELFELVMRHAEAAGIQFAPALGSTIQVLMHPINQAQSTARPTTPTRLMNAIQLFSV
jgi:small-conductance mechanosensitive channel